MKNIIEETTSVDCGLASGKALGNRFPSPFIPIKKKIKHLFLWQIFSWQKPQKNIFHTRVLRFEQGGPIANE